METKKPTSTTIHVEESVQLQTKPSAVWALLGDYNGLYRWHPAVAASQQQDKIRVLTLADGAQITEKLISIDEEQSCYSYSIEESPLPISHYQSSIQVKDNGQGGSVVSWSSHFNADGASDQEAEEVIRGIYQAGLSNLAALYN